MSDSEVVSSIQSREAPFMTLESVKHYIDAIKSELDWTEVGVIYDEKPSAILIILVSNGYVEGVLRFCLDSDESVSAISHMLPSPESTCTIYCCQGETFDGADIYDIKKLTHYRGIAQSTSIPVDELHEFFSVLYENIRKNGRGSNLNTEARNQVLFTSHGRCMFGGCGIDLTIDPLTGVSGNYGTLAHNVASSEKGARGILYLSDKLSNDPDNVLLLCDIHHRLIDSVAKLAYPAHALSAMRQKYRVDTKGLLDSLANFPMPSFCVCWPVHQEPFSSPTAQQIADSLSPLKARHSGQQYTIVDSDETLRTADENTRWTILPSVIENVASQIMMQATTHSYRAALFATGTMPALIGLGAKIGNKSEIIPMLKHRENGSWHWPTDKPVDDCTNISGLPELTSSEPDIILQIALTAMPPAMIHASESLGFKVVTVSPNGDYGNGALPSPQDGMKFRQAMQELLHTLQDRHNAQTIHVMPCASNAACVFFGQAFDNYHPTLKLYDFAEEGKTMAARLHIYNYENKCCIQSI